MVPRRSLWGWLSQAALVKLKTLVFAELIPDRTRQKLSHPYAQPCEERLIGDGPRSQSVQVLGRLHDELLHARRRQASEKRKAGNRGRRIAVGAAGYGARGASSRWSNLRGAIGWTDRWRVVGGLWRVREEVRGLEIAGHGKDPFGLVWAHGEGQLLRLLEVVDLSCEILRLRVTRNRNVTPLMLRLR
jgi:hypothetical protein